MMKNAPLLICPLCRTSQRAAPLDDTLVCTNEECGAVYTEIEPEIPCVTDDEARVEILKYDEFGDLDGDLVEVINSLTVGSTVWSNAGLAGMYLFAHYADPNTPFVPVLDWAWPKLGTDVATALDLGCGPGRLSIELARRSGGVVVGLETNPLLLRWARRLETAECVTFPRLVTQRQFELEKIACGWADPTPGSVSWLCADGLNPPFLPNTFDLVTCFSYLDNSRDPSVALGQACALTRPGGNVLIATPDAWMPGCTAPEYWIADSVEGWTAYLEGYGMELVAQSGDFPWLLEQTRRYHHRFQLYAMLARKIRD